MKDNKQIFNEAFFKKATYAEKQAKQFPQYSPVDLTQKTVGSKVGTSVTPAFQVTDTDEVKKRLAGTFGVAFGSNNVKNMANRAIKTFPIIISDNIEPETAVMLKKLMEEQYAEYINLLISNQVVNLSDFSANDPEGNIAIQALDQISGNDFSKSRVANAAARKSNISMDDLFTNIPLYNLLRENEFVISTGEPITDALLEGAMIIPSEHESMLVDYMLNEVEIVTPEKSNNEIVKPNQQYIPNKSNDSGNRKFNDYMTDLADENTAEKYNKVQTAAMARNDALDVVRGYHGTDEMGKEIYSKLSTGDIVINPKQFDAAINRSVGDMLADPKNIEIKRRFEAAMMLMQSRRISGVECYNYCTKRLGIPVSDNSRKQMITQFKAADIRDYGKGISKEEGGKAGYVIGNAELKAISENRIYTERIVKDISKGTWKDALGYVGSTSIGGGIGLGTWALTQGAGIGGGVSASVAVPVLSTLMASPLMLTAIGAIVGVGGFALARLFMKRKFQSKNYKNMGKTEGWERVEYLIDLMFKQQEEIRRGNNIDDVQKAMLQDMVNKSKDAVIAAGRDAEYSLNRANDRLNPDDTNDTKYLQAKKDYITQYDAAQQGIARSLREGCQDLSGNKYFTYSEFTKTLCEDAFAENINNILNETVDELAKDSDFVAEMLTEKTLATSTMPMKVQYVQKKEDKDLLMTPSFMARDTYAYGSTEIERKENKDRRYNQPLIMTVKFKERFSDGKYNDNELTAVIGILGKIIRVSSQEMEYILKENTQGNTIEGIFKTGDFKNAISDMLSTSKISKDLKSLPQSADVWRNLEKVATLASANKISGKRNSNVANAHIVFSQREIDAVRTDTGVDYLKDPKKAIALMKRYSAFTLMVANDAGQRVYIMDDQDDISWNVVPYSALAGKDSGDQLNAALNKMMRL